MLLVLELELIQVSLGFCMSKISNYYYYYEVEVESWGSDQDRAGRQ